MRCKKCNGKMVILEEDHNGTQYKCLSDGFRFYKFKLQGYNKKDGLTGLAHSTTTYYDLISSDGRSTRYHLTMSKPPNKLQAFFLRLLGFDVEVQ